MIAPAHGPNSDHGFTAAKEDDLDLQVLADTAGHDTFEEILRATRSERSTNDLGQWHSWRCQARTEIGAPIT